MQLQRPLAVVTPTIDGDVLSVLSGADDDFTAPQVHALLEARSVEGVRRALQRLTAQGIVTARSPGHVVLYRLNRDHLAAGAIVALTRLRSELIERLRTAFSSWTVAPVCAVLFGSAASGDMRTDSDIDLFVVRPQDADADDPVWRAQVKSVEELVSRWTGNDVRVLEYATTDLNLGRPDPVVEDIRRHGITLSGALPQPRRRSVGTKRTADQAVSTERAQRSTGEGGAVPQRR